MERRQSPARYGLLVLAIALAAVAGSIGYVTYPRFDLPRATGIGLLVLASAAGVASFFSPCSFPLLLTMLARSTDPATPRSARIRRALVFGGAASVGAAVFVLAIGTLIALGGREIAGAVTYTSTAGRVIRSIVGVLLIALGLVQLGVLRVGFHAVERVADPLVRGQARLRRERPAAGFALFGFGYLLAGFG